MLQHLTRIADILLGIGLGAIIFWIAPAMIRQHKKNKKVDKWWTKFDVKGESSRWK